MKGKEVKDTKYISPCISFTTSDEDVLGASDLYSDDHGFWKPEGELS